MPEFSCRSHRAELQHARRPLRGLRPGVGRLWLLTLALLVAMLPQGAEAQECIKMYKEAFKGISRIPPKQVGGLFLKYCKKNMKMGSVKSMDELCAPIVKKVEDKMLWVPEDESVTPEIVCKTIDDLKKDYPEHAANAAGIEEARKKREGAVESAKKELAGKAKLLGGQIADELKAALGKEGEKMAAELQKKITSHVESALGPMDKRKEKIVKQIMETVTLGMRGLETKTNQKKEEVMKEWLQAEAKEIAKKAKENEGEL
mmetsp:Transcript_97994/g.179534  ORF Transcript_97994/g.179534 Transcript_97994/m.179534 type:complete len:260 (-) Transcript_97994:147-926(-)